MDHTAYVRQELELRQKRRMQYSMRAFARDLEISPSFLCEFLAGRQGVSKARAAWISDKIKLSEDQREHFWDMLQARFAPSVHIKSASAYRVQQRAKSPTSHLSLERFHLIADWYHFALLELLELPNAPTDNEALAKLLDISALEVEGAIRRLELLGLLTVTQDGDQRSFKTTTQLTTVGEEISNQAIQASHQQMLRMQADAVERKPFSQRENLSVSFSVAQKDWPAMRKEMQKAMMDVVSKFNGTTEPKDQVVAMAMQMITLVETPENPGVAFL